MNRYEYYSSYWSEFKRFNSMIKKEAGEVKSKLTNRQKLASALNIEEMDIFTSGGKINPWIVLETNYGTFMSHHPDTNLPNLRLRTYDFKSREDLIDTIVDTLVNAKLPDGFTRKQIDDVLIHGDRVELNPNRMGKQTLATCINMILSKEGDLEWLPVLQDILWQHKGWKKVKTLPKAKAKVKQKPVARRARPVAGNNAFDVAERALDDAIRNLRIRNAGIGAAIPRIEPDNFIAPEPWIHEDLDPLAQGPIGIDIDGPGRIAGDWE
jgi:hypothetical protein